MKIVVCVKQVPEITDVNVDPETGTLIREGVTSILNPFCEYALDHAARLGSANNETEVIAITMGPPQAKTALYRCLELGADRAVLVSDRKFAGADTGNRRRYRPGGTGAGRDIKSAADHVRCRNVPYTQHETDSGKTGNRKRL